MDKLDKHNSSENGVNLHVRKRNGTLEILRLDAITRRMQRLSKGLNVNPTLITLALPENIKDGITTAELDELTADLAVHMAMEHHPDYATLAARIMVSNLQKKTKANLYETMKRLYDHRDASTNKHCPLITADLMTFVQANADVLQKAFLVLPENHQKYEEFVLDYDTTYFGLYTLQHGYLMSTNGQIEERVQHMKMRIACALWMPDVPKVLKAYGMMSRGEYTHASPTIYNAGTHLNGLSSCFLLMVKSDSIEGIYDTVKQCAKISQAGGGIGLSISNVRAKGSYIEGTRGRASGVVPMLTVFNSTARYVDQGGGKRKGSAANFLEPWHADVLDWLELKDEAGPPERRCRDLFYGFWLPDVFMQRVEANGKWSFFCPHEAPGLDKTWGKEFQALYEHYERQPGLARKVINARDIWKKFISVQLATGGPYLMFKDACNAKSNHKHLGIIRSSNLCTEIVQYYDENEIAVCNLISLALPKYVTKDGTLDHVRLGEATRWAVRSLNQVIDRTSYPLPECRRSNMRHRPMAIGVQGLAEMFIDMNVGYGDEASMQINKDVFESMYYHALAESCEMAKESGFYESFPGSPTSEGILQFDMWNVTPSSGRYDWAKLKQDIMKHGLRNSLLIGLMPTASTSQILGNSEGIEPLTTNVYIRKTHSGSFNEINTRLVRRLQERDLWTKEIRDAIISKRGRIADLLSIPEDIRRIFVSASEISARVLIQMAADRGAYVDQSQSFSIEPNPAALNYAGLTTMHFLSWKKGLKTASYYIRQDAAVHQPQITTVALASSNPVVLTSANHVILASSSHTVASAASNVSQAELDVTAQEETQACRRGCDSCSG